MNLDKIFHLKENHTDVKTEVMAGITTFMTMAYILAVIIYPPKHLPLLSVCHKFVLDIACNVSPFITHAQIGIFHTQKAVKLFL